ncbi:MAG: RDD family protein [Verrucomicrobia bacterium]|nr:RDD family protein [Verrucomicrobiota bacterium]
MKSKYAILRFVLPLVLCLFATQWGSTLFAQELSVPGNGRREASRVYRHEIVVFGQDVTLRENEVSREIVVIGGNLTIEGTAEGDVVVVFGSVKVTGTADRDLVVVFGSADLAEGSEVDGDAVIVGGTLNVEPGAALNGGRREFAFGKALPDFSWAGDWFLKGVMLARPIPPQFPWVWAVAGVFILMYLFLAAVFPQPVGRCVHALETTPAASFVTGILALTLLGPLAFLLVVSVAGILVLPVLVLALLAATFLGKLAIYQCAGKQVGRQFNLQSFQQPSAALFLGLVAFYLIYTVPVLGFLVWGLTLAWGLGAVFLAIYANFQSERPREPEFVTSPAALARNASGGESPSKETTPPELPDSISFVRAGFWVRLWASFLDVILLGILMSFTGPLFFLFWAAYHVVMWVWKGTTIGGIVAGIRVLRVDGQPMSFSVALVRSLSSFFSAIVLFLGFFWAGWDREKQSWHDKIAGTIVVKMPKGISLF